MHGDVWGVAAATAESSSSASLRALPTAAPPPVQQRLPARVLIPQRQQQAAHHLIGGVRLPRAVQQLRGAGQGAGAVSLGTLVQGPGTRSSSASALLAGGHLAGDELRAPLRVLRSEESGEVEPPGELGRRHAGSAQARQPPQPWRTWRCSRPFSPSWCFSSLSRSTCRGSRPGRMMDASIWAGRACKRPFLSRRARPSRPAGNQHCRRLVPGGAADSPSRPIHPRLHHGTGGVGEQADCLLTFGQPCPWSSPVPRCLLRCTLLPQRCLPAADHLACLQPLFERGLGSVVGVQISSGQPAGRRAGGRFNWSRGRPAQAPAGNLRSTCPSSSAILPRHAYS